MAAVALANINEHYRLIDLSGVKKFKLPIIFVLGGPGAGKSTLCCQFRAHYGISYISLGSLLRLEAGKPTVRGRQIAAFVHQLPCQRVPADLVMVVLKEALVRVVDAQRPIFIQGFPRDFEQAARYEDEIGPIRHVMYINTSEETSKKRLTQRNKLAARFEDNSHIIHMRREAFRLEVLPVIGNLCATQRVMELDGDVSLAAVYEQAKIIFRYWAEQCKKKYTIPEVDDTPRLKYGNFPKRILAKPEADIEKNFPSVHYHGPIYDGHY